MPIEEEEEEEEEEEGEEEELRTLAICFADQVQWIPFTIIYIERERERVQSRTARFPYEGNENISLMERESR